MKAFLNKLTVLFLSFLFLLSFMGLRINKHYCASCDTNKHFLFFHPDCCHLHEHTHKFSVSHLSCCSLPHEKDIHSLKTESACSHNDCCEDSFFYLKLDNTFINPVFSFNTYQAIIFYKISFLPNNFDVFSSFFTGMLVLYDPPPLLNFGKTFLSYTSCFIFYDCK